MKKAISMTLRIPISSPLSSYVLVLALVHMSCARQIEHNELTSNTSGSAYLERPVIALKHSLL